MKFHPTLLFLHAMLGSLFFSCAEKTPEQNLLPNADAGSASQFQSQLFSVPSPVHTAMLIQNARVEFNESLLNPLNRIDTYVSESDRALNMGIYGADMAYISNYNRPQLSQQYFTVVGNLANQLDILQNIDQGLLKRFSDNAASRDSLLSLTAAFYTEGDRYLKTSERQEIATLILLGGWVEALYLSCHSAVNNKSLTERIGEQRPSVKRMAELMNGLPSEVCQGLAVQLRSLDQAYEGVETTYQYDQTITDSEAKTTYLRGRTITKVDQPQLEAITAVVDEIRNSITQ